MIFLRNWHFDCVLCDFFLFLSELKLNKDSLTLNDIWCEMKYHNKL